MTFFIGRLVEQQRAERHQRVEPAAGLVERFGDEIGRVIFLKLFLVLKWVVPLGERHRPGVEPAVDDLADAGHPAAAFFAADVDLVDHRLVQLNVNRAVVGHGLEFGDAADQMAVAAFAFPDRQRRAPVTLTGNAPVDDIFEEVAKSAVTDGFRGSS